jgi:hypothetical protein
LRPFVRRAGEHLTDQGMLSEGLGDGEDQRCVARHRAKWPARTAFPIRFTMRRPAVMQVI